MSTPEELKRDNAQYLWHPMAHPGAMKKSAPDIIARGEGCFIWDVDGHRMLDGVGGLWSSNLGHSNRRVRDAVVAQLDELPFYNVFRGTTHVRAIELSTRLVKLMAPENVAAVLFSNGGSDAVEGALKIARQYWKLKGQADRFKFISLRQGYHGVHFGGMSVNGNTNFRRPYEPLLPGCFHVDTPWLYHNPFGLDDPEALGRVCAEMLEREIVFQGPDTVAAFIAEPIQGAGGVIVPPANYWRLVRQVCDRHGVLLIADEVVTGFGRGGALFGTRLWGVNADLWCLAKGISSGYVPLGATAIGRKVAEVFDTDTTGGAAVSHGYTYSAHPVAAAAALATLDLLEELDIPGNAARVGACLQERLQALHRFSFVGDVRGMGLMAGIEMVTDKARRTPMPRTSDIPARVAREAYRRGLMVRISGPNLILSPPLVITREEIDQLVDLLDASFAAVEATL
ncbi:aminotransferase class III-fold pyridoxal phosphate-dependent enzyme [Sphaerotilus sp.]|uniref:aminotransferase class III-fold pyridoxal phosphate-dependent enzyme n=1 Tax=Sphaerotilus sp. TaxID=2093942 RepID=UPI00286E4972|nr:aminotransferase class III-fold pyridoxal phosphate-dependent enzyme [Sphaerotilus sp.]